jgi:Na+-translocating ferredoxin:NAD+ oxidoreductase RNF subunit RnfB
MIEAALALGAIGCLAALGLGAASIKFAVEVDPRVEEVNDKLPGVNCGACGLTGCVALAEAIVNGEAMPNACIPGGEDTAKAVAEIMGLSATASDKKIAVMHCKGVHASAVNKGEYIGIRDCRAAALVLGSPKGCNYGCIGFSTCVRVCAFDAIYIGEGGIAVVDEEACTGCGACAKACPKSILDIRSVKLEVHIRCNSPLGGKAVKSLCSVACIGCKRCIKTCPVEAIEMQRDLAVMDPEKCISCGLCAQVCPTSNIDDRNAPRKLVSIVDDNCIGCTKCGKVCPVDAVAGERKAVHTIDPDKCVSCYRCIEACPKDAIVLGEDRPKPGAKKVTPKKDKATEEATT